VIVGSGVASKERMITGKGLLDRVIDEGLVVSIVTNYFEALAEPGNFFLPLK
jgi:hypothetical protein